MVISLPYFKYNGNSVHEIMLYFLVEICKFGRIVASEIAKMTKTDREQLNNHSFTKNKDFWVILGTKLLDF